MLSYDDVGITHPEEGIIEFEILPEHLKLLRALQLKWDDAAGYWGSLQTNPTRPYGTNNFVGDVNAALGTELLLSEEQCIKLHRAAAMALQICLKTGKFKAAKFRASKYSQNWTEFRPKKMKE